jgi:glycosyltransferase involved in cell wall biosynthesis
MRADARMFRATHIMTGKSENAQISDMSPKTVALVDWSWIGHHPTYFCLFAKSLLRLGLNVRALCPKPEEVSRSLADLPENVRERLFLERLPGWASAPRGTPDRWKNMIGTARSLCVLDRMLRHGPRQPDLVFFACMYDVQFYYFGTFRRWFRWKWAGLYLLSFGFRSTTAPVYELNRRWAKPEKFLRKGKPAAIATLDEGISKKIEAIIQPGKCVVFPDITNTALPETGEHTLAGKLRRFAAGRKIVLLSGTLFPQRGVDAFLQVAMANPQWCFALVGELPYFSDEEKGRAMLDEFLRSHPCSFFHPLSVPDGPAYNAVIAACDVVWNIHLDWPGSSNTLTKAAFFEKPVVVGEGHLLAERTRDFRLGEVCPERSIPLITQALHAILDSPESWKASQRPQWQEYREAHSDQRLQEVMGELMATL